MIIHPATGNFLRRLNFYENPIESDRLMKEVLEDCKRERKGLSKQAISEKGYDIYENKHVRVSDLLSLSLTAGYAKVVDHSTANQRILITEKGVDYVQRFLTNDFSQAYQDYKRTVDQMFQERNLLELHPIHVMGSFWSGKQVEEVIELCQRPFGYQEERMRYHQYLLSLAEKDKPEDHFLFHFMPKLFLPRELIGTPVSLEIEGVETPEEVILERPYPNKRYVVAGFKNGKTKTSVGFYPLILPKDEFPKELVVILKWKIENYWTVIHWVTITFEFADHPGRLFSTEQHLARSNKLNSFQLTTHAQPYSELWKDRNVNFGTNPLTQELIIHERVTLQHFPIELHAGFSADKHFQKWLNEEGTKENLAS